METKICRDCKYDLPLECFEKRELKTRTYFRAECKKCSTDLHNQRHKLNSRFRKAAKELLPAELFESILKEATNRLNK